MQQQMRVVKASNGTGERFESRCRRDECSRRCLAFCSSSFEVGSNNEAISRIVHLYGHQASHGAGRVLPRQVLPHQTTAGETPVIAIY
jgi:hypothetical protein